MDCRVFVSSVKVRRLRLVEVTALVVLAVVEGLAHLVRCYLVKWCCPRQSRSWSPLKSPRCQETNQQLSCHMDCRVFVSSVKVRRLRLVEVTALVVLAMVEGLAHLVHC
jgi:hypothetical protein